MESESRKQKFKRLASKRTTSVLNQLRLIGNLSNKANYDYDEADVRKIFRAIDEQLRVMKAKFRGKRRREFNL